jgi:hypothetical protein
MKIIVCFGIKGGIIYYNIMDDYTNKHRNKKNLRINTKFKLKKMNHYKNLKMNESNFTPENTLSSNTLSIIKSNIKNFNKI